MLVGDLIWNNNFDCNCNFAIYDCSDGKSWHEVKEVYSTKANGWHKPLDEVLDMEIIYITTNNDVLIIEAKR